jgi:hypothetical protein
MQLKYIQAEEINSESYSSSPTWQSAVVSGHWVELH